MKVGSIVVARKCEPDDEIKPFVKWLPVMDEKTPYTIRTIDVGSRSGALGATFEEGIIGETRAKGELIFPLDYLREILPPEEISIESIIEQEEYA